VGLFTVFIYYILRLGGEALAETGRLSPFIGTWAPNIILGSIGIYLLIMAGKDRPVNIQSFWNNVKRILVKGKGH
jgi:lipopolysaccharide export system permease protein